MGEDFLGCKKEFLAMRIATPRFTCMYNLSYATTYMDI